MKKIEREKLGLLENNDHRQHFQCPEIGIVFGLEPRPIVLPEVQACRLVTYLCSFDPRVKPLLTLIRYWAEVNEIRLAKPNSGRFHPPDPAALDWLVIFFLCHRKKMLPTPRQVQARTHAKLFMGGFDIGFSDDSNFVQQFNQKPYIESNEVVGALNIFNLAVQFFRFYVSFGDREVKKKEKKKRVVLNMRDGEVIPMEQFVGDSTLIETKLSEEEREMAREVNPGENPGQMILLHPLYLKHGFSFCDKTFVNSNCPAMDITKKKLEKAFKMYSMKKNESDRDFRSALLIN